jgi:histidinol-phosphatase (PHP family)
MEQVYHIHDQCCRHASNTLKTVVQTAIKEGYKELFFTEHCPLDNNPYIIRPTRGELQSLRKEIGIINSKYKGKLIIHFGFEAEYSKCNQQYFDKFATDPLCDYMIFGNHYLGDL